MTLPNFFNFVKHFHLRAHRDPARDWLLLLAFSTIALAGIIVWNVRAFDTVANGGTIGKLTTTTAPLFSRSSLDTIHTIFTSRAAEEAKYMTGAYRYADPSQ